MLSRRTLILATLLLTASPSLAGERLKLKELVARCDAVVEVSVVLATSKTQDKITEISWLTTKPEDAHPLPEWIGGWCLPSRKTLTERWLARLSHISSMPLWRAALDKGGYCAVIFLKKENGELRPTCETESILVENWVTHPNHAAWRARLMELIAQADHLKSNSDSGHK